MEWSFRNTELKWPLGIRWSIRSSLLWPSEDGLSNEERRNRFDCGGVASRGEHLGGKAGR